MFVAPRTWAITLVLLAGASPASAQWSRVPEVPVTDVFSVFVKGDTITAGTDTSVYLSTDAGATWSHSTRPVAGVQSIQAARVLNGRLYAGTFGQGVFVSDDLGATWQDYNQGLVGGVLDSQLDIGDLEILGDSLYAATLGAGVYVRRLTGPSTWSHFGEVFEPNQASNVNDLASDGRRLLASAGGNGTVFFRDPGDADWTISWLDNLGLHPGLSAIAALWNGGGWVVGTNLGVFLSLGGEEPWTRINPGFGSLFSIALASRGRHLFGAFDVVNAVVIAHSDDDGATWPVLEVLSNAFVYQLAVHGTDLYAGRVDGLWRRSTATVSVPPAAARIGLSFALAGPQPIRDVARLRFVLREPGPAAIDVFDTAGRRVATRLAGTWPAGVNEVAIDARRLPPGVYQARLSAAGRQEAVRVVRVR